MIRRQVARLLHVHLTFAAQTRPPDHGQTDAKGRRFRPSPTPPALPQPAFPLSQADLVLRIWRAIRVCDGARGRGAFPIPRLVWRPDVTWRRFLRFNQGHEARQRTARAKIWALPMQGLVKTAVQRVAKVEKILALLARRDAIIIRWRKHARHPWLLGRDTGARPRGRRLDWSFSHNWKIGSGTAIHSWTWREMAND